MRRYGLFKSGIEVRTIDGFQGREQQITILSLVRTSDDKELKFFSDPKRLNVALSRSQEACWVIGTMRTSEKNKPLKRLIDYIKNIESFC
jgi:superfamily I DNA and/or RNA helicase